MQDSACRIPAVPWGRPWPCLFTDTMVLAWQTTVGLAGSLSRADSPVWKPLSLGGVSEESCKPCPAGSFCPSLALALPPAPVRLALNAPWTPGPLVPLLCSAHRYLPGHKRRGPRHPQGPVSGRSSQGLIGEAAAPSPRPHSAPQPPHPASCSPALQAPRPKQRRKDKALPFPSQGP